jgi:hypothetical protein
MFVMTMNGEAQSARDTASPSRFSDIDHGIADVATQALDQSTALLGAGEYRRCGGWHRAHLRSAEKVSQIFQSVESDSAVSGQPQNYFAEGNLQLARLRLSIDSIYPST